jgi:hypothetical protein
MCWTIGTPSPDERLIDDRALFAFLRAAARHAGLVPASNEQHGWIP